MTPIDDHTLTAFADGELNEIEKARVELALAGDPSLRARLEAHRRVRGRLAAHYAPVAEEPVPERFRQLLDPKVVPFEPRTGRISRPPWQAAAALAATLVLGLVLGQSISQGGGNPIAVQEGELVAEGQLAEALETQLASAQTADAPVRIGVTFPGPEGRPCRTFEGSEVAGLACRGTERWRLMLAVPGGGGAASEYRQAGAPSALVMEAAQELMAGDPLGPEEERRARDAGWD